MALGLGDHICSKRGEGMFGELSGCESFIRYLQAFDSFRIARDHKPYIH